MEQEDVVQLRGSSPDLHHDFDNWSAINIYIARKSRLPRRSSAIVGFVDFHQNNETERKTEISGVMESTAWHAPGEFRLTESVAGRVHGI
jgi:hypothetical protein